MPYVYVDDGRLRFQGGDFVGRGDLDELSLYKATFGIGTEWLRICAQAGNMLYMDYTHINVDRMDIAQVDWQWLQTLFDLGTLVHDEMQEQEYEDNQKVFTEQVQYFERGLIYWSFSEEREKRGDKVEVFAHGHTYILTGKDWWDLRHIR